MPTLQWLNREQKNCVSMEDGVCFGCSGMRDEMCWDRIHSLTGICSYLWRSCNYVNGGQ